MEGVSAAAQEGSGGDQDRDEGDRGGSEEDQVLVIFLPEKK